MLMHLIQVCSSYLSQGNAALTPEGNVLTNDFVALPSWEENKQRLSTTTSDRETTKRRSDYRMTSVSCYNELTKGARR